MKVRVEFSVDYETDDFWSEIEEYADDHEITNEMIREFCIDRAFNLTAVDPKGKMVVTHIPVEYQVM
jgi:hypothetical protein